MTLSKRLKALEKEMGPSAPAPAVATGHEPRLTLADLEGKTARELHDLGALPVAPAGTAPGPGELPAWDDLMSMSAASLTRLYFAEREKMTPREWQAFYTKLLNDTPEGVQ